MVNPQFAENSFGINMEPKGIKVATIFTGFCNRHDTETFESIENRDYQGDTEQDFSFAYRAFAFEYHRAQEAFRAVTSIASPEFELLLQGFRVRDRDLAYYKRVFDEAILSEDYGVVDTVHLRFEGAANVAVCSSFFLEYDIHGNRLNDARSLKTDRLKIMMFNAFPQGEITYALFSWLKEDASFYQGFQEQLFSLTPGKQLHFLNNLVANYCENTAIGPDLWKSFDSYAKQAFLQTLGSAVIGLDDIQKMSLLQVPRFDLFIGATPLG